MIPPYERAGRGRALLLFSPMLYCRWRALLTMREAAPHAQMIYIGEFNPFCNADQAFFDNVISVDDPTFYQAVGNYKQMPGVHDLPFLCH